MNGNVIYDLRMFEQIGVPTMNSNYIWADKRLPNLKYNKKYYRLVDDKLITFKVLASALNNDKEFVHLIQEVGKSPMWCKYFSSENKYIYDSIEDVFTHAESGRGGINVYDGELSIKRCLTSLDMTYIDKGDYIKFKQTYYWCKYTNKVCTRDSNIKYVYINENGIFFGLSLKSEGEFFSKADVIKARFNGLEVIVFPPTDFDINIKVETIPSKPIIRTLTIIED